MSITPKHHHLSQMGRSVAIKRRTINGKIFNSYPQMRARQHFVFQDNTFNAVQVPKESFVQDVSYALLRGSRPRFSPILAECLKILAYLKGVKRENVVQVCKNIVRDNRLLGKYYTESEAASRAMEMIVYKGQRSFPKESA